MRDSTEIYFVKTTRDLSRPYSTLEEAQAYALKQPEVVILRLNLGHEEVLKRACPILQSAQLLEKNEPQ